MTCIKSAGWNRRSRIKFQQHCGLVAIVGAREGSLWAAKKGASVSGKAGTHKVLLRRDRESSSAPCMHMVQAVYQCLYLLLCMPNKTHLRAMPVANQK
jgi:hypothetical protein